VHHRAPKQCPYHKVLKHTVHHRAPKQCPSQSAEAHCAPQSTKHWVSITTGAAALQHLTLHHMIHYREVREPQTSVIEELTLHVIVLFAVCSVVYLSQDVGLLRLWLRAHTPPVCVCVCVCVCVSKSKGLMTTTTIYLTCSAV